MSLALIEESAREVRRLAIAGSPLAVGDFRLKKLIPPLEQAGAKVPVFAQVAKAIANVINGSETESAANLLSLSALLNAILYTQGQTGTDGAYRELETFPTNCSSTRITARTLKPLIAALTTSGAGRFEIIKEAAERGAFADLRLIQPALTALEDTYPELADLVAEKILPTYGPGLIPLLKQKLDLKGKKGDARRLRALHQLDPAATIELCKTAFEEGSVEPRVAAIACLGQHEDCIPLVLGQADSKNKVVRAAALEALAQHDRPEILKLFTELIKGNVFDLLAQPLRAIRNRQVVNSLLTESQRIFGVLAKGDQEQIPRFWEILDCLQQRKDLETEEFLLNCFNQCDNISNLKAARNSALTGADLAARLASLLYIIGSSRALEAILARRALLPPASFSLVLYSALRTWSPAQVYEEFAPLLQHKKGAGKQKNEILERTVWAACLAGAQGHSGLDDVEAVSILEFKSLQWDSRWIDAAINADRGFIVCCLAREGHPGALDYLLKMLETKSRLQIGLIIEALARCRCPGLTDRFLEIAARKTQGARFVDFDLKLLFQSMRHLPAADLPRLEAFASTLDQKFIDEFLDALEPLRASQPNN